MSARLGFLLGQADLLLLQELPLFLPRRQAVFAAVGGANGFQPAQGLLEGLFVQFVLVVGEGLELGLEQLAFLPAPEGQNGVAQVQGGARGRLLQGGLQVGEECGRVGLHLGVLDYVFELLAREGLFVVLLGGAVQEQVELGHFVFLEHNHVLGLQVVVGGSEAAQVQLVVRHQLIRDLAQTLFARDDLLDVPGCSLDKQQRGRKRRAALQEFAVFVVDQVLFKHSRVLRTPKKNHFLNAAVRVVLRHYHRVLAPLAQTVPSQLLQHVSGLITKPTLCLRGLENQFGLF